MNKILISQPIDEAGMQILEGRAEIIISPEPTELILGDLMKDADGLIIRTAGQVTRHMLEEASRLRVISRTGGGLNNIDIQAATDHNVVVCGVKGPQDRLVAEHTVFFMGALAKRFFYLDAQTRKGNFKSRFEYQPQGLSGKRLGLIGLGRIGSLVAAMCSRIFEMEVWAFDPYVDPKSLQDTGVVLQNDITAVIQTADFLSLHVPLADATRGLMGKDQFDVMKPTAFMINTSRGEVIQEDALVDALNHNKIAGAALDVFETEPPDAQNPLFQMENVILTPHAAALTKDAVAQLAEGSAQNVLNVLEGKKPSYSPNWEIVQAKKA
ncbi:MAG: hydroxyacid dehydrogenase [Desulfobacterales bacterium]